MRWDAKKSRYGHLSDGVPTEGGILKDVNPELLGEMITAVLSVGDAVLCGITRDGGSVRIILMSGDEKTSTYLKSAAEVDDYCKRVASHVREMLT